MPHPKDEACCFSALFDQDRPSDKDLLVGCRLLETEVVTFCYLALHSFKYNTCGKHWRPLAVFDLVLAIGWKSNSNNTPYFNCLRQEKGVNHWNSKEKLSHRIGILSMASANHKFVSSLIIAPTCCFFKSKEEKNVAQSFPSVCRSDTCVVIKFYACKHRSCQ